MLLEPNEIYRDLIIDRLSRIDVETSEPTEVGREHSVAELLAATGLASRILPSISMTMADSCIR